MRISSKKQSPCAYVPYMPDGSKAYVAIDQSMAEPHLLNVHGWPQNNVQEYVNNESQQIKDMMLKNLEIQRSAMDPNSILSDSQKAALTGSRYCQTSTEFINESLRLDRVRASLQPSKELTEQSDPSLKFTDDDKETSDEK